MITMISPVTICSHTKLLQYYWPYSLCCTLHLHGLFLLKLEVCTSLHLFHRHTHPSPFWQPLVCSLYSRTISRIFYHFTLSNTYIELKKKFYEIMFFLTIWKASVIFYSVAFFEMLVATSLTGWSWSAEHCFVESSLGF